MSLAAVFDPLFRTAFLTGLVFAVLLPLIGAWMRIREEWLASLGLAQMAAAGGLIGILAGWPLLPAALGASGAAALAKGRFGRAGNDAYALMVLAGWGLTMIVAANMAQGEDLAHALVDGQLYFVSTAHLAAAGVAAAVVAVLLPRLARPLLVLRFFPDHFSANGVAAWRYHVAFDLLVVLALGIATMSLGVMGSFGLVFVPGWAAFRVARHWRGAVITAVTIGGGGYVVAFALALLLDQPFGPVLVATLGAIGAVVTLARR